MVDDNPTLYDVQALSAIKSIHENLMKRSDVDQDAFFARILLNGLERIEINSNSGSVMIGSPGATQITNVNVKHIKSKVVVSAPTGSIGEDVNISGYIQHLIKRYNKYASGELSRKAKFSYGALSNNIENWFGAEWRLLPIEKGSDVVGYI